MNTLQSNVDYLTNKVETNSIDKINNEDFFKYEQDPGTSLLTSFTCYAMYLSLKRKTV